MIFLRNNQRLAARTTFIRRYRRRAGIGFLEVIVAFGQAISQSGVFTTVSKVKRAIGRSLTNNRTVIQRRNFAAAVCD